MDRIYSDINQFGAMFKIPNGDSNDFQLNVIDALNQT